MTFYATEIDINPAFGWQAGPAFDVLIRTLRNGSERRNLRTSIARHTFTLPFQNIRAESYLRYIKSAFLALGGPANSFLVKDYGDYTHEVTAGAGPMQFGTGDGVTTVFQLSKTYTFGSASYVRDITKPVAGAAIYAGGTSVAPTISTTTGEVTFAAAPGNGVPLYWVGEFRVPVRFQEMSLPATIDNKGNGDFFKNASCSLIEVIGE